jgi:hypothetical protein
MPGTITPAEVADICRRLKRLGFVLLPYSYLFPDMDTCDFLFVNTRAIRVPLGDRLAFTAARALLHAQRLKARLRRPAPAG